MALVSLLAALHIAHAQEAVVAMDLGAPAAHAPASESDWSAGVALDHFLRANGEDSPLTPTSASLVWDKAALYIRFRCADPGGIYRDGVRLPRSDRVEVGFVAPSMGQQDLWQLSVDQSGSTSLTHAGHAAKLESAKVEMGAEMWTAVLVIPWQRMGGLPSRPFHLQLSRVREITGEVSSPSAVDEHDGPVTTALAPAAIDEFIETTLGGGREIQTASLGLVALPSGIRRWEHRPVLPKVSTSEREEIAHLQLNLGAEPTSNANLANHVRLAELWYDLLDEEGFRFHYGSGGWGLEPGEPDPWTARHRIDDALRDGDAPGAYVVLDSLLRHLDRVSSSWFADGTPGDVRVDAWTPISAIDSASALNNELVLHARAGGKRIDLFLSFPSVGGVRLHGAAKGYFAPASSYPVRVARTPNGVRASANKLAVDIGFTKAWHIDVEADGASRPVWGIRAGELSILRDSEGKISGVDMRGGLGPGENIFGFGERFDSLNQRGKTLTLWQLDAFDAPSLTGLGNQAYKPIPFWHSSSGYSIFWNTSYPIRADCGSEQQARYRVTANGPVLDIYVWPGSYEDVLREYTALTGKPLLPPAWAFEPWMGGGSRRWAGESGKTSTQALMDVAARFRLLDIPHSSIYAEGVGMVDPLLYRKLQPMGVRILAWGRSQPFGWSMDRIKQALPGVPEDKLPLMRLADGRVYGLSPKNPMSSNFPYIDFTDPKGIDLLRAFWKPMLDLGVSGTMVDFGDLVPRDALFHDGTGGAQMHNWYVHGYNHAEHQMFQERRGADFILFARGAAPGTQVDAGQMSGDHASTFRGLEESITGGLSVGASGFSNWGSDVGGLVGRPDEEVYLRWIEFGTFSPLMRFHGTTPREPWSYSDAAVAAYKKYAWLRENLLPYIDGSAQDASATGVPMMRALPAVAADEYMFGDDLLVAPVHAPGERRAVALPAGDWTDLWTGAPVAAGARDVPVPLAEIPVFLRAGALVPIEVAPDFQLGESMSGGRIPALIVTPASAGRTAHLWRFPKSAEVVRLESTGDDSGFTVTAENWHELQYLSIQGLRARVIRIEVNGAELPELDGKQAESFPPGWKRAGESRIIVRLPVSQKYVVRFSTK